MQTFIHTAVQRQNTVTHIFDENDF